MAMINCPECGKSISDKAHVCPNCGYPIEEKMKAQAQAPVEQPAAPIPAQQPRVENPVAGQQAKVETSKVDLPLQPIVALMKEGKLDEAMEQTDLLLINNPSDPKLTALKHKIQAHIDERDLKAKKKKRNIIIAIVVALALIIGGYAYYSINQSQQEEADWELVQNSTDANAVQDFLDKHPDSKHADEAKSLLGKLKGELAEWQSISLTTDYPTLLNYVKQHPTSPYSKQAQNLADSICWNQTVGENTPDAYTRYMSDFPTGMHFAEATDKAKKLNDATVNTSENSEITQAISGFFTCLGNKDEDIVNKIAPTMKSFLGKKNVTKATVLEYMHKQFVEDIKGMSFSVSNVKVKKSEGSDGEYRYQASCSIDQKIDRSDASKMTYGSYTATVELDGSMMIVSLNMKRISSK